MIDHDRTAARVVFSLVDSISVQDPRKTILGVSPPLLVVVLRQIFLKRDRSMLIICSGDKAPSLGCSSVARDEHLRHRRLQHNRHAASTSPMPEVFCPFYRSSEILGIYEKIWKDWKVARGMTIHWSLLFHNGHAGDTGKSPSTSPGVSTVTASPLSTSKAWNYMEFLWIIYG